MHAFTRFATALLCGGALAAGGAVAAAEPGQSAGDCFVAAFKAGNADAVAACYAEDALMWFPGGPLATGRAAIRDGFAQYLAGVTVKDVELKELGRHATSDTVAAWGTYAFRTVDKATQAETLHRGRFTDVQKKIDGRWLYIVDHPSDDPAPADR